MSQIVQELAEIVSEGLESLSLDTCSRYSSKRRIMGAPLSGPYSWKYHPWVKGMLDADSDFCYAMKGAQLGVTEVAVNRAFYTIDRLRRDVLYVLPTEGNATDFSKARFDTALMNSPKLARIFDSTNNVGLKQAGGVNLYIRGSRADSKLKSVPASVLILDEVDEMDDRPILLALERLSGQIHKNVWGLSTPTIPNQGIHSLYLTGTQEHFYFKCPGCSRRTELIFPECLEVCGEHFTDPDCGRSYLKCKECSVKLEHRLKPEWLACAEWVATRTDLDPDVRSFYINQLYSFTVNPKELAIAYLRGQQDEAAAQEFNNSKIGIPYIGTGAKITEDQVNSCIGSHSTQDDRPQNANRLITLGLDVGDMCYYTIDEWFVDGVMTDDLNAHAHRRTLDFGVFMRDEMGRNLDQLMVEWQVHHAVIDPDPELNEARRFARRFPKSVTLCRYREGKVGKEMSLMDDSGVVMATVDRTSWLSASLGRFKSGRVELPIDTGAEFKLHIQEPTKRYFKDPLGGYVARYVNSRADHYAHAFTYSEIALPLAASVKSGSDVEKFL